MKNQRLVLFVLWALLLGAVTITMAQVKKEENAVLLGTFRQELPGFAFSRDGRHAIIGFAKNGKEYYEVDGKPGEQYEDCTRPAFSSNSRHWVYAGKKDDKWWVITDQGKYGPFDGVGGATAPSVWMKGGGLTMTRALINKFSGDGKRVGFAAAKGNDWVVYLDGKPLGNYQSLGINSLTFDSTGNHFAFWGKQGGKWYLILDGKRLEPASDDLAHDWVVFSPDGQHVLWAVKQGAQELLLMDGKKVATGKTKKPIYSSDGTLWIAAITKGGRSFLLSNGKKGAVYHKIVGGPVLSPDGKHVAFAAKSGEKVFVMRDNRKGPEFASISWLSGEWVFMGESPPVLRFSPDSQKLAYAAKRAEKKNFVIVDDNEYGPYETIVTIKFSPDSKRFGFLVKKGKRNSKDEKYAVVVDGEQSQWYDQAAFLVFSKDGKHYAYTAKTGERWMIVVDGSPLNTRYKDVNSLLFGPRGNLIIAVTLHSGKSTVLVNGKAGREWDEVSRISSKNLDESGTLYYLAVSEGKLYRVARVVRFTGIRK